MNKVDIIAETLRGMMLTPTDAAKIKERVDERVFDGRTAEVSEEMTQAFELIREERHRQDTEVFPDQRPGSAKFDAVGVKALTEEALEVVRADQDGTGDDFFREVIHVGAVAVKILEHIAILEAQYEAMQESTYTPGDPLTATIRADIP